jgi:hypothetical protein
MAHASNFDPICGMTVDPTLPVSGRVGDPSLPEFVL